MAADAEVSRIHATVAAELDGDIWKRRCAHSSLRARRRLLGYARVTSAEIYGADQPGFEKAIRTLERTPGSATSGKHGKS